METRKQKRSDRWAKTDAAAASVLDVTRGCFSKWKRASDFPADARTRRGWDISVLREYRDARRARSLDPRQSAGPDAATEKLIAERDRLKTLGLQLRAAVVSNELCDRDAGRVLLERFNSQCRQATRSALGFCAWETHDRELHELLHWEIFGRVLEHVAQLKGAG